MYQAKTTGRNRSVVYDPAMRAMAMDRLQLESDLTGALARDEFVLHYQPVIELATDRLVGFEALLRWEHPTRGTVMPDRFIPLAEENGMIIPIGRWVLRDACNTAAAWLRRHDGNFTMAVNLSARQLASPELLDDVQQALVDSGLAAARLVLEMTETSLVQDAPLAAARLHELRALGVRLAIDDFGNGSTTLAYLGEFPVDILKIDRSFIRGMTDNPEGRILVQAILDLARALKLDTVAEGIELQEQRTELLTSGCASGQGFFFAEPVTPDGIAGLLDGVELPGSGAARAQRPS
jgi:EAL domain-containing protein (putative c-di-GMP-specific phosphodiesterase class I)